MEQFAETSPGADLSPARRLVCGGFAGITSVTFTYPLDIVRTRLSVQSTTFAAPGGAERRALPGMWKTLITIYKTEGGIRALYRGILPTVAGVAPYVSLRVLRYYKRLVLIASGWPQLHDIRISKEISYT